MRDGTRVPAESPAGETVHTTVIRSTTQPHLHLRWIDNAKAFWEQRLVRSGLLAYLNRAELCVLAVLKEAANVRHWEESGELMAWPSAATIGRRGGMDPRTYYDARRRLIQLGLLVVRVQSIGGRKTTQYLLAMPPETDCPEYTGQGELAARHKKWAYRSTRPDLKRRRSVLRAQSARAPGAQSARAPGAQSASPADTISSAGAGAGASTTTIESERFNQDEQQQPRTSTGGGAPAQPPQAVDVVVELLRSVRDREGNGYGEGAIQELAKLPGLDRENVTAAIAAARKGRDPLALLHHLLHKPDDIPRKQPKPPPAPPARSFDAEVLEVVAALPEPELRRLQDLVMSRTRDAGERRALEETRDAWRLNRKWQRLIYSAAAPEPKLLGPCPGGVR